MTKTRRGTIWSHVRWIHPQRTIRGSGVKGLREKLKYFQYRDDRDTRAPKGGRRWVDHGLGESYGDILKNCRDQASHERLAWSVMLSPKPRLMLLIEDESERRTFLENLTEDVIEGWLEARGGCDLSYSYVLHDRATNEEGLSQLHTHIILPGTVETSAGRERFDNRPSDLRYFNTLVEDLFEDHMDRQLGFGWREQWKIIQREDALRKALREMMLGETQPDIPALSARMASHGLDPDAIPDDLTSLDDLQVWLNELDSREPDLDTWFGGPER